ncbi:fimbria/pilus periplasmic chaperone [Pseudomonas sp. ERGC3:01]|nr:fimbria/pilus periplasmic chaperone [Pseudomonas sp. ERGC3:01]
MASFRVPNAGTATSYYLLIWQIKAAPTSDTSTHWTIGNIMNTYFKHSLSITALVLPALIFGLEPAYGSGMSPDKTVLLIDEGQGEATMNVTNTDNGPSLLVSTIYNLEGDDEEIILVNPPMARVEAGDMQSVRFILEQKAPWKFNCCVVLRLKASP